MQESLRFGALGCFGMAVICHHGRWKQPMSRPSLIFVVSAFLLGVANAADRPHHWVEIPDQKGVRVDLNSIELGQFPTGGDSSPIANTRGLIDVNDKIGTFTVGCDGMAPPHFPLTIGPHAEEKLVEFICGRRVWRYDPTL
jgi:hypothetical protein